MVEADLDLLQMHEVGRADHQQVEGLGREHRLERLVPGADRDIELLRVWQACRRRIDIADDGEIRALE